jgi:hypothetical protein
MLVAQHAGPVSLFKTASSRGVGVFTAAVLAAWALAPLAHAQPPAIVPAAMPLASPMQARPLVLPALRAVRDAPHVTHRRARHHARREPERDSWSDLNDGVSEVFFRFFGNIAPAASGIERPSVDEHMLDAVVAPIAGSEASLVILGAGNNRLLTSLYFYQQYDGILGLRYGLIPEAAHSPFQISLTGSSLHGSLSQVSRHVGIDAYGQDPMPSAILLGGAVGIDATYTSDVVRLEARAYAMPEVDAGHSHATGVSQMESFQVVLRLPEMFHFHSPSPLDLYFVAMHVDRGDARTAVYEWVAQGFRTPGELREVFQAMVVLTFRRD